MRAQPASRLPEGEGVVGRGSRLRLVRALLHALCYIILSLSLSLFLYSLSLSLSLYIYLSARTRAAARFHVRCVCEPPCSERPPSSQALDLRLLKRRSKPWRRRCEKRRDTEAALETALAAAPSSPPVCEKRRETEAASPPDTAFSRIVSAMSPPLLDTHRQRLSVRTGRLGAGSAAEGLGRETTRKRRGRDAGLRLAPGIGGGGGGGRGCPPGAHHNPYGGGGRGNPSRAGGGGRGCPPRHRTDQILETWELPS
jgi:hypothetical protein